ncbi:MAG: pentapeptide repeat-containing protein [Bacteroidia bacterium]
MQYRDRWNENEVNVSALRQILALISKGGILGPNYSPFPLVNGRIDMRGIDFTRHKWKSVVAIGVDFSGCTLSYCWVEECRFENCLFEKTEMIQRTDHANKFVDCDFVRSKCNQMGFGNRGSQFAHCRFDQCNLTRANFYRPEFDWCVFSNCKLNGLDFWGSSFENCAFAGKVEDVWFRGGYPLPGMEKEYGVPRKNRMLNVSFADAEVIGGTFSDGCDLSTILLPQKGNYRLYSGWRQRLERLPSIYENWPPMEKREADIFMHSHLSHAIRQDWYLLNVDQMRKEYGQELFDKLLHEMDC